MTLSQIVFGLTTSAALGLIGLDAASGRMLVTTPTPEKAARDPSVRLGSSQRHHWFIFGGGYHGGK